MTSRKPLYLTGSLAATLAVGGALYYFLYLYKGGADLSNQGTYIAMWCALIAISYTKRAHPLVFALSAAPLLILVLSGYIHLLLYAVLLAYYGPGSWLMARVHQPDGDLSDNFFLWCVLTTPFVGCLVLFYLVVVLQSSIEQAGRFLFGQPLSGPVLLGALISLILWRWYRKQAGGTDA